MSAHGGSYHPRQTYVQRRRVSWRGLAKDIFWFLFWVVVLTSAVSALSVIVRYAPSLLAR